MRLAVLACMAPRLAFSAAILVLLQGCFFWSEGDGSPPDPYDPPPDCGDLWTPTAGELGLLEFTYDYGAIGCLFGCSANEPIAERSKVEITAYGDVELPPIALASDRPDVATFEISDDGDIVAETHAPGEVRLEMRDAESGELLEALALTVKPVGSIASDEGELAIMVGGHTSVPIELLDERGCKLVGAGGIDYVLQGGIGESQVTLIDALAAWLFEPFVGGIVAEQFSLDALALGSGEISMTAPSGASLVLPIAVVDASAVSKITLSATESGVRVHSPECAWTLLPEGGPVELSSSDRDTAFVTASTPGAATIQCTIGSARGELALNIE
jgi:hypothetical protein